MMQKAKVLTKGIGLFLLLMATFVFAMFQGGFVSWFLFYTFLPFALYSLVLFVYPLTSFQVERNVTKKEYAAGDTVEVHIRLTRNNRFPLLYILVADDIGPPWGDGSAQLVFIGFKKSIECTYLLEDVPRGKHIFRRIHLQTGDVLGLCQKRLAVPIMDTIIVFPFFHPLHKQEFERLVNGNGGASQRATGEQLVISGVREYQAGDQLSRIHWKATARTNKMMTKEFEEQKSEHFYLILDCEHSPSFENLISFVAAFAQFVMRRGGQLGYIDSENEIFLPIQTGERHQKEILYQLAQVTSNNQGKFHPHLLKGIGTLSNQVKLVIMTSKLTLEKLEVISAFRKSQHVTCIVVQTEEMAKEANYSVQEAALKRGIKVNFFQ
jgi:uncharacterized protein (DUF58 family)